MIDKEWQDGDDTALVGSGYAYGVRDAVLYIRDELGIDLTDSNVLLDMAGGDFDDD